MTTDDPNLGPVVVSEEAIRDRTKELGARIAVDYAARPPLLVGVLKGAFVFMSDLARAIDLPVEFDFMAVASYGSSTRTSGVVRIVKDLDSDLTGRHVLVVEDIVDSGLTLAFLLRNLAARHPASLAVCEGARAFGRRAGIRGLSHPEGLRGRLRARRCRALPQPQLRAPLRRPDVAGLNE